MKHRQSHHSFSWHPTGKLKQGMMTCLLLFMAISSWATTTRISESTLILEEQGSRESASPSLSGDGKLLVFESLAPNLVAEDHNRTSDIFLRETDTGILRRISIGMNGVEANGSSDRPVISRDGRFVAYRSSASNLVPGDNNDRPDLFLYDIQTGTTTRVNVDSNGNEVHGYGYYTTAISGDGRFIAFSSDAANLVTGDTNNVSDVFLHDTQTGQTRRISVDSKGTEGNDYSDSPSISADGRWVAFTSSASNLVSGDTEGHSDVFVHDTLTHETIRISTGGDNDSYRSALSADGRYLVFDSLASNLISADNNAAVDIFLHDLQTKATIVVSKGSGGSTVLGSSFSPVISADGKFIAYESSANLVSGDTNDKRDIYLFDVEAGVNVLASIDNAGTQGNRDSREAAISADGKQLAFVSEADNLVADDSNVREDIFLRKLSEPHTTTRQSLASGGPYPAPPNAPCCLDLQISADGRYVIYDSQAGNLVADDTNSIDEMGVYFEGIQDIFVSDTDTQSAVRISIHSDGTQGNQRSDHPSISADGRYAVFESSASNLVDGDTNDATDVFLHDLQTQETHRISLDPAGNQLDTWSASPDLSADGRFVVFISDADNLVTGDTNGVEDVFVLDRQTGDYKRVNISSQGGQVTESSNGTYEPRISGDGRYVVFQSDADNLVAGDTNGVTDVFVHDLVNEKTWRVSVASNGEQANAQSGSPVISDDGRYVAYVSLASNLAPGGDFNNVLDIFLYDMQAKTTSVVSVDSNEFIGNDHSNYPEISPDGRYVTFLSGASNLVTDDWNNRNDIFIRDTQAGTTIRASINDAGTGGDDASGESAIAVVGGSPVVAFASNAKNLTSDIGDMTEVFLYQPGSCSHFSVLRTITPITMRQHWQCSQLDATDGFEVGYGGFVTFGADRIVLGPGFRIMDGGVFQAVLPDH